MKQKRIPLPLIIYYAGLFFLLAGYILLPMLNTVGSVVLGAGLAAGIGVIFYAMFKYNKGIF